MFGGSKIMRLVLIDNKHNKNDDRSNPHYQAIKEIKNNIEFCNKAIRDLIDPISYNNSCIKVRNNIDDYYKLLNLTNLLGSNKTRKMFQAIKKDRKKKEVAILNNLPMTKVKRYLNNAYDILTLINSIQILFKEQKKANKQNKKRRIYEQFKQHR